MLRATLEGMAAALATLVVLGVAFALFLAALNLIARGVAP